MKRTIFKVLDSVCYGFDIVSILFIDRDAKVCIVKYKDGRTEEDVCLSSLIRL